MKHSPVEVESRVPAMSLSCPGGVKCMSWCGGTAANTSTAAAGSPDIHATSDQHHSSLPDGRMGVSYSMEERRSDKMPGDGPDGRPQSLPAAHDVYKNRCDLLYTY